MQDLILFNRSYRLLGYKIFHRIGATKKLMPMFKSTKKMLHKAGLYMPMEEYIATALLTISLFSPFLFLILRLILINIYELMPLASTIISFIAVTITAAMIILIFMVYPSYKVDNIKRNI